MKLLFAEILIEKAQLAENQNNFIHASHILTQGIMAFKNCKGQQSQISSLQMKLEALNQKVMNEMKRRFSTTVDLSTLIHNTVKEMQVNDLLTALLKFAHLPIVFSKKQLENNVKELAKLAPLRFSNPTTIYNQHGRIIAIIPPLIDSSGEDYQLALKAACYQYSAYQYGAFTQGIILPACAELLNNHLLNESVIFKVIQNCYFIPPNRTKIWLKGFLAGFNNDFTTALSLLIPQFEQALRTYLEANGVLVWYIDSITQTRSEKTLKELLNTPEALKLFGEDIQFHLQGLLIEQVGHNFRNKFAHGLMSESEFHSFEAVYLWWLFLHIIIRIKPVEYVE